MSRKEDVYMDRQGKSISREMIEEIIDKDLFPAGFTSRNLDVYFGCYRFYSNKSTKRCVKRGDLKCKQIVGMYNIRTAYYWYK